MSASFRLKPGDAQIITASVARAEEKTAAEIVVVVQPQSGTYTDLAWVAGAIASVLVLVGVLFVEELEFNELVVAPVVFGTGWVVFALVAVFVPPVMLAAKRVKRQVDDAAHATFSRYGLYRTSGRTGILLYYSVKEREGRVLVDTGISGAVPSELRDEWRARLHGVTSAGALAELVEDIGARTGQYLPRAANDVDELSNAAEVSA